MRLVCIGVLTPMTVVSGVSDKSFLLLIIAAAIVCL